MHEEGQHERWSADCSRSSRPTGLTPPVSFRRIALRGRVNRTRNTHETVLCELVKRAGQADGEDGHVDGEVVLAVAAHVHQLLAVKALFRGLRRGEREKGRGRLSACVALLSVSRPICNVIDEHAACVAARQIDRKL